MTKRIVLIQILLVFQIGLYAQSKGKVRVYTKPMEEVVIKIGEHKLSYGEVLELDTGSYTVLAWAPKRKVIKKEIKITANGFRTVAIKLPYSEAYNYYKRRDKIYRYKKYGLKYGALTAYGILSTKFIIDIIRLNKSTDKHLVKTEEHMKSFQNSVYVEDIQYNRKAYMSHKKEYENEINKINRRLIFIQAGAIVSVVATYFTRKKIKDLKQPAFYERPRLTHFQINPRISPYTQEMSITYQF